MKTVYLDLLFFNNAVVDYLLLLATARFCGEVCARLRAAAGALLGGAGAVLFFFEPFPLWVSAPLKILLCLMICLVVFGHSPPGGLLRLAAIFFLVTLCFAGVVFAFGWFCNSRGFFYVRGGIPYLELPPWILLGSCIAAYLMLGVAFGGGSMKKKAKDKRIECIFCEKSVSFIAVVDTGNMLKNSATGRKIIVVDSEMLGRLIEDEDWRELIQKDRAEEAFSRLMKSYQTGFSLTPYQTIEGDKHWMLCLKPDLLKVDGKATDQYLLGAARGNLALPLGQCAVIEG